MIVRFRRGISKALKDSITFVEWKELHKGTYDQEFYRKPEDRKELEKKEFETVTGRNSGKVQRNSVKDKKDKSGEDTIAEPKGE